MHSLFQLISLIYFFWHPFLGLDNFTPPTSPSGSFSFSHSLLFQNQLSSFATLSLSSLFVFVYFGLKMIDSLSDLFDENEFGESNLLGERWLIFLVSLRVLRMWLSFLLLMKLWLGWKKWRDSEIGVSNSMSSYSGLQESETELELSPKNRSFWLPQRKKTMKGNIRCLV